MTTSQAAVANGDHAMSASTGAASTRSASAGPASMFPNMTGLADEFALADPDERFELLIDIFVDGLARHAAAA